MDTTESTYAFLESVGKASAGVRRGEAIAVHSCDLIDRLSPPPEAGHSLACSDSCRCQQVPLGETLTVSQQPQSTQRHCVVKVERSSVAREPLSLAVAQRLQEGELWWNN